MSAINKHHYLPDHVGVEAATAGSRILKLDENCGGLIHAESLATHAMDVKVLSKPEVTAVVDGTSAFPPLLSFHSVTLSVQPAVHGSLPGGACHG